MIYDIRSSLESLENRDNWTTGVNLFLTSSCSFIWSLCLLTTYTGDTIPPFLELFPVSLGSSVVRIDVGGKYKVKKIPLSHQNSVFSSLFQNDNNKTGIF